MAEVNLYRPSELVSEEWGVLQRIERDAFASTLDRSQAEIDTLVSWENKAQFYASHLDPNTEVGGNYNSSQSYTHPLVAVATENDEAIGFAYSAHNVSGTTSRDRLIKRLTIVKNYLWMREIAVKPGRQRQGVAKQLGRSLLKDAIPFQPVTAYIWPDEDAGFMKSMLEGLGFAATGEQQVSVFGEHSAPVRQVRMKAPSARAVLKSMR